MTRPPTNHLREARKMLYDLPNVAIGHALIAIAEELHAVRGHLTGEALVAYALSGDQDAG